MNKIWEVSRGPITPSDKLLSKANAVNSLLIRSVGILPSSLEDQIRPFAIGLFDEFRALLKPDVTPTALRRAVAAYVHSSSYYLASAQPDAMRHDIDGKPLEPISDQDRSVAQQRFVTLRQKSPRLNNLPNEPVVAAPALTKAELIRAYLLNRTDRNSVR